MQQHSVKQRWFVLQINVMKLQAKLIISSMIIGVVASYLICNRTVSYENQSTNHFLANIANQPSNSPEISAKVPAKDVGAIMLPDDYFRNIYISAKSAVEYISFTQLQPKLGGVSQAMRMMKFCQRYNSELEVAKYNLEKQGDYLNDVSKSDAGRRAAYCDGVGITTLDMEQMHQLGLTTGDQNVTRLQSVYSNLSGPNYKRELSQVLDLADGLLLGSLGMDIFYSSPYGHSDNLAYFDGVWYSGEKLQGLALANTLAACDLGLDCGPNMPEVILACLEFAMCYSDFYTLFDNVSKLNKSMSMAEILSLRDNISTAITSKNIDSFLPKK